MNASAQAAVDLVHRLFVLIKAAAVYGPENEGYRSHSLEARAALAAALAEGRGVRLEQRDERMFFDESPLSFPPGDAGARFLIAEMRRRGVATIEFLSERAVDQLDDFVYAFQRADPRRGGGFDALLTALCDADVTAIAVLPPANGETAAAGSADDAGAARRAFLEAVGVAEELMTRVREGREPDFDEAARVVGNLAEQVVSDSQTMFELSVLQNFDEYTYAHCVNVSVYSVAIGVGLGLDRERLRDLGFAGLFHDVGKAKLPRELIDKPDEFDEDDWRQIRRHPALGARELLSMERPLDSALAGAIRAAFEHHLGVDARGYPRLARPRRQGLFSRVCAIADSFDAMTSGRVYAKRAMSPDEAVRRMVQRAGTGFDPLLLRVFLNAAGIFPIGTLLRLESGERAVVRRNDASRLLQPQVAVLQDGAKARGTPRLLELEPRMIRTTLDPRAEGVDAREVLRSVSVSAGRRPTLRA